MPEMYEDNVRAFCKAMLTIEKDEKGKEGRNDAS